MFQIYESRKSWKSEQMRKLDKEIAHQAYIVASDNHLHPPALLHALFTLLLMHTSNIFFLCYSSFSPHHHAMNPPGSHGMSTQTMLGLNE
jgi:hypothetical protein